jgi:hypothetical protein
VVFDVPAGELVCVILSDICDSTIEFGNLANYLLPVPAELALVLEPTLVESFALSSLETPMGGTATLKDAGSDSLKLTFAFDFFLNCGG